MQIDVDFDVFKALTVRRDSEDVTYNDVLRDLLALGELKAASSTPRDGGGCSFKGVFLPNGTRLQVIYKGTLYQAEIRNGQWLDQNGTPRSSPSDAASAITKTQVNGWRFWDVKRPNDPAWRKLIALG